MTITTVPAPDTPPRLGLSVFMTARTLLGTAEATDHGGTSISARWNDESTDITLTGPRADVRQAVVELLAAIDASDPGAVQP